MQVRQSKSSNKDCPQHVQGSLAPPQFSIPDMHVKGGQSTSTLLSETGQGLASVPGQCLLQLQENSCLLA